MNRADRIANLALFAIAGAAWIATGHLLLTVDPRGDAGAVVTGAVLIGVAVGATLAPVLWLAGFARRRIAFRGDWARALRRAALVGLVVLLLVLLRGQGALTPPLGIFIVAIAILVEVTLSLRRS